MPDQFSRLTSPADVFDTLFMESAVRMSLFRLLFICAHILFCLISFSVWAEEISDAPLAVPIEAPVEEAPAATLDTELDPRIPAYTQQRPFLGVQLSGTLDAFKSGSFGTESTKDIKFRAIGIHLEYEPPFLQGAGVFGIGPGVALFPVSPSGTTPNIMSIWSAGIQARYQFRYFREQPIVPVLGYTADFWHYRFKGSTGNTILKGPLLGAYILLNFIDPSSAAGMYSEYGILRTYLIAEMRAVQASDGKATVKGSLMPGSLVSLYLGLRFEM